MRILEAQEMMNPFRVTCSLPLSDLDSKHLVKTDISLNNKTKEKDLEQAKLENEGSFAMTCKACLRELTKTYTRI